jgi:hypothetical protein
MVRRYRCSNMRAVATMGFLFIAAWIVWMSWEWLRNFKNRK